MTSQSMASQSMISVCENAVNDVTAYDVTGRLTSGEGLPAYVLVAPVLVHPPSFHQRLHDFSMVDLREIAFPITAKAARATALFTTFKALKGTKDDFKLVLQQNLAHKRNTHAFSML